MIIKYEFKAKEKGPRLLFFGAIHGNEICGPRAMKRLIEEFMRGKVTLKKGSVTFVPICNPRAYKAGQRYISENLNRIFRRTRKARSYESRLANQLTKLVDVCDVLIDIHSITAEGAPFFFVDRPTKENLRIASILGPTHMVSGWSELYEKIGKRSSTWDTETYAASKKKMALTVECGQHRAPQSVEVAYRAIRYALAYVGLTAGKVKRQTIRNIKLSRVYFRRSADETLAKKWAHLNIVRKGDVLIRRKKGGDVIAPHDGYIIMPTPNDAVSADWLYLGK